MDDNERSSLQAMVEYYRSKSYKLEHEYLSYKIYSESTIKQLTEQLQSSTNAESTKSK